jgi:hypothetical protein
MVAKVLEALGIGDFWMPAALVTLVLGFRGEIQTLVKRLKKYGDAEFADITPLLEMAAAPPPKLEPPQAAPTNAGTPKQGAAQSRGRIVELGDGTTREYLPSGTIITRSPAQAAARAAGKSAPEVAFVAQAIAMEEAVQDYGKRHEVTGSALAVLQQLEGRIVPYYRHTALEILRVKDMVLAGKRVPKDRLTELLRTIDGMTSWYQHN